MCAKRMLSQPADWSIDVDAKANDHSARPYILKSGSVPLGDDGCMPERTLSQLRQVAESFIRFTSGDQ